MKKMIKSKAGFTLVEIMIVVAIIGLLAAIGIPSFMKAREKSLNNTKEANIKQIEGAIEQYALDNSLTNGQSVAWGDATTGVAQYLKDNDVTAYKVGGEVVNEATLVVGREGGVEYMAAP